MIWPQAVIDEHNAEFERILKEMDKYSNPPCFLCGRRGTHYFKDNAGAWVWVCEDAPHCNGE